MNSKHLLIAAALVLCSTFGFTQTIFFSDDNMRQGLVSQGVDTSGDNQIQVGEAEGVDSLNLSNYAITNTSGLEFFINLEKLTLTNPGWGGISSIDLNLLPKLQYLDLSRNVLEELNVSHLNLSYLDVRSNFDLSMICVVNEVEAAATSTFFKDNAATWTEACSPLGTGGNTMADLKIVKAYDLLGNELDPEGYYGGVIIFEYNDGTRHRIYSSY